MVSKEEFKEIEDLIRNIVNKLGNKKSSNVQRDFPNSLILQKKFVYSEVSPLLNFENLDDFGPKIICDCLARICNSLIENKVTSICLGFLLDQNNKICINKLYFSSKKA